MTQAPQSPPGRTTLWLWLAVFGVLLTALAARNFASLDLWGKLAIPALWLRTGQFPYTEPFAYTALGNAWVDHEWLSGVIWYGALAVGGDLGLSLLKTALVGLMLWSVMATARCLSPSGRGLPWLAALILLVGLMPLTTGLVATGRPQIWTFTFIPLMLWFLVRARRSGHYRPLVWLVPLGWLWANAHGGVVAGWGLLLLFTLGEALSRRTVRPYLITLGGMVAVSLLNPYGLGYWSFLAYAVTLPRPEITEWRAVPLWSANYWPIKLLAIGVLLSGWQALRLYRQTGRPLDVARWLLLSVLMVVSLKHIKHQPMLVLGAAALLPPEVWVTPEAAQRLRPMMTRLARLGLPAMAGAIWAAGLVLPVLFGATPWVARVLTEQAPRKVGTRYPVGAVRALQAAGFHGNLMTPFEWGEFVMWALYPKARISMDGRLECVYPMSVFRSQQGLFGPRWPRAMMRNPVLKQADALMVPKAFPPLNAMEHSGEWHRVYDDAMVVILSRHPMKRLPAQPVSPKATTVADWFPPAWPR